MFLKVAVASPSCSSTLGHARL